MRVIWVVCVCLAFVTCGSAESQAGSISEITDFVGAEVQKYLLEQGQNSIGIENFGGPPDAQGKLVENGIRQKLTTLKINVDDLADWKLRGNLQIERSGSVPEVALNLSLVNADGKPQQEFLKRFKFNADERNLDSVLNETSAESGKKTPETVSSAAKVESVTVPLDKPTEAPKLVGVNADNQQPFEKALGKTVNTSVIVSPSNLSAAERQERINQEQKARTTFENTITEASSRKKFFTSPSSPSVLKATPDSRFALEIHKRKAQKAPAIPLSIQDKGGRAFVDLQEGDFVDIIVINENDFEVALELIVDGINTLQEAENPAFRKTGRWVISPKSRTVVNGWFISPDNISRFQILSEPDGVAAKYGAKNKIGTIQANFYMCYGRPKNPDSNSLEMAPLFTVLHKTPQDGAFGLGPKEGFTGEIVERVFDPGFPLATLTVLHRNPDPPGLPVPKPPALGN